jgi:hypothetical protein
MDLMIHTHRVLAAADVATTVEGINSGTCREANPVMKPFTGNTALTIAAGMGFTELWLQGIKKFTRNDTSEPVTFWMLVGTAIGRGFVVGHNLEVCK